MAIILPLAIGAVAGITINDKVTKEYGSWASFAQEIKEKTFDGLSEIKTGLPSRKEVKKAANTARVSVYKGLDAGVRGINRGLKQAIEAIWNTIVSKGWGPPILFFIKYF